MKKRLARIWQLEIDGLHFILYQTGLCRIDIDEQFTTIHYTGKDRLKWWHVFEDSAKKSKLPQLVIDRAFIAFTGI